MSDESMNTVDSAKEELFAALNTLTGTSFPGDCETVVWTIDALIDAKLARAREPKASGVPSDAEVAEFKRLGATDDWVKSEQEANRTESKSCPKS